MHEEITIPELTEVVARLSALLGPRQGGVAALEGGITNRNYRLRWGGADCVLRLPGKDTALLGIDRRAECAATRAAAAAGIGPEVIAFEPRLGCLVTRFIEGRPVTAEQLRERIPELARALHAIHAGPPLPVAFDPFAMVRSYAALARERGGSVPAAVAELEAAAGNIRAELGGPEHDPVPCHNDLLTANLLDDGERLRIVDWEYAGMGDPYFELANVAVKNGFAAREEAALLEGYWGAGTPERTRALALMRVMASYWEGMWGVLQATVSELDFDFAGYAEEHLGKGLAEAARAG